MKRVRRVLARPPSSTRRSVKLVRARLGGANQASTSTSAIIERGTRAATCSTRGAKAKQAIQPRRTKKVCRLYKPTSKRSRPSPPQARFQESHRGRLLAHRESPQSEGGDQNTYLAGHGRGSPRDEDLPARTNQVRQASINLTSGHSRRHPAEATESSEASLFDRRQKTEPKKKGRGASSNKVNMRRKMESSASREHVADNGEQPQRVPVLGL
jgi:hypothetical protein